VPEFREEEGEKMMEYYMLLQSHIAEANKADVDAMLLIPANIADMTRTLRYAEGKRWRDQLGRIHPLDIGELGNSAGRGPRVMAIMEDRKPAGDKKVHFPPPKSFDPEEIWRFPCLAGLECKERHSPTKCKVFNRMSPREDQKRLCRLCDKKLLGQRKSPPLPHQRMQRAAQSSAPQRADPGQSPVPARSGR
jgi:hypothetical protein